MFKYFFLIFSAFIASVISGIAGFGGSTLLTPILILIEGAKYAVPLLTICMFFSNTARVIIGWKQIAWIPVGCFLITAAPLSALGAFGFTILPKDVVTRVIGIALLLFVIFRVIEFKEIRTSNITLLAGGTIVGLISGLVGSAGPIGAALFLSLGLSPIGYIASEAATAATLHVVKIFVYGSLMDIPKDIWILGITMGLIMLFGTYLAKLLLEKIEINIFQTIASILLGIVSVYMIITG